MLNLILLTLDLSSSFKTNLAPSRPAAAAAATFSGRSFRDVVQLVLLVLDEQLLALLHAVGRRRVHRQREQLLLRLGEVRGHALRQDGSALEQLIHDPGMKYHVRKHLAKLSDPLWG